MLPGIRPENLPRATEAEIPVLQLDLPVPVTALHQVEITSRCNLRCGYCPSPTLQRPKVDMTRAHYLRALEHAKRYVATGQQVELNLAGIGESTLHPDFVEYLRLAREVLGWEVQLTLATNGLTAASIRGGVDGRDPDGVLVGWDLVASMAVYKPCVWVSLHRPEKAGIARKLYAKYGLLHGASVDPSMNSNDWAGQVDEVWKPDASAPAIPCMWIRQGQAMAMADGRVTACCLDGSGGGVIGHVDDEVGSLRTRPYKLCATCHQHVRVAGYDQRAIK